ncbi:ABC transporter substrate-binding protein [Desulfogranum japonicum]|uniref:ABC transporter substrate-binding protein n=1 Tax=Desulfogranum japonicum TaxID=231447 RepID=UPI00042723A2|nr:ABC transporter substrate-binding protein [Desulfogranum japonicum]
MKKLSIILSCLCLACISQASAEELLLYTSQPAKDAQQTVEAFMEQHPDIELKWFRDGTTKLMTKLRAELSAGQAQPDVLLIADMVTLESLKQEKLLAAYMSPEAKHYESSLYEAAGYYYSTKLITTGIVYNTRAPQKPEHWTDLAKPEYKNQVAMPSPLYSGAALIHLAALTANPDIGWDYYENLAKNQARAKGGNGGTFKAVASGEKPYGMVVDFLAIREKSKGSPVEFVFPEEGVSVVTEPVAIMAGAQHKAAAETFVDFLLSEKGQNLVITQGYIPARNGLKAPEGFPPRESINVMPFSPAKALADTEKNKQRFSEIWKIQ